MLNILKKTTNKTTIFLFFFAITILQSKQIKFANNTKLDFFAKIRLENKSEEVIYLSSPDPKETKNAKNITSEITGKINNITIATYETDSTNGYSITLDSKYFNNKSYSSLKIDINGPEDIVVSEDK